MPAGWRSTRRSFSSVTTILESRRFDAMKQGRPPPSYLSPGMLPSMSSVTIDRTRLEPRRAPAVPPGGNIRGNSLDRLTPDGV